MVQDASTRPGQVRVGSRSMNRTLTQPAATLSRRMGEGLGVRGFFQPKFMTQFARISRLKLSMMRGRTAKHTRTHGDS